MQARFKRFTALILSVLMVLTCMPMTAMAEETVIPAEDSRHYPLRHLCGQQHDDPLWFGAPRRAKVEVEKGGRKQGTTPEDNPGTRLPNR